MEVCSEAGAIEAVPHAQLPHFGDRADGPSRTPGSACASSLASFSGVPPGTQPCYRLVGAALCERLDGTIGGRSNTVSSEASATGITCSSIYARSIPIRITPTDLPRRAVTSHEHRAVSSRERTESSSSPPRVAAVEQTPALQGVNKLDVLGARDTLELIHSSSGRSGPYSARLDKGAGARDQSEVHASRPEKHRWRLTRSRSTTSPRVSLAIPAAPQSPRWWRI